jgi:hypothetical protein
MNSKGITFVSSFVKAVQLVQKLNGWNTQTQTDTDTQSGDLKSLLSLFEEAK